MVVGVRRLQRSPPAVAALKEAGVWRSRVDRRCVD
jgi:hypothetical protein